MSEITKADMNTLGFNQTMQLVRTGYEEFVCKYTMGKFVASFIDGNFVCCSVKNKDDELLGFISTVEQFNDTLDRWYPAEVVPNE